MDLSLRSRLFLLLAAPVAASVSQAEVLVYPHAAQSHENVRFEAESSSKNTTTSSSTSNANPQHICRTYLAPSTIPGANLGLFAGVSFGEGDETTPGDGVVPITNLEWNNGNDERSVFLWEDYVWSGNTFANMRDPIQDIDAASFGIGAVPNCFFALLNVEDGDAVRNDHAGLPRHSPGIGAFTPYHDRRSFATREIQAGEELFVDYGYDYFEGSRKNTIGLIPFLESYQEADRLLDRFSRMRKRRSCRNCERAMEDVYDLTRSILSTFPTRTLMAMPSTVEQVDYIRSIGGTAMTDKQRSIKPMEDIQSEGLCMDHLVVKPSTIPDAGRGTFAKNPIQQGEVVAPVPLIHLPERKVMDIYQKGMTDSETDEPYRMGLPKHQQLLLNYCFGHRSSTILLCPYGVVSSLINHAPDSGAEVTANVRIAWSNKTSTHLEWLDQPISDWAYNYGSGLSFEFVATRDIQVGEEVLVDYGPEWEDAWKEHKKTWKNGFARAADLYNKNLDFQIPTYKEWKYTNGDPNLNPLAMNLWCRDEYRMFQGLPEAPDDAYPCKILSYTESGNYNVEIVQRFQNTEEENGACYEEFDEVLFDLPRDALAFGGEYEVNDTREYMSFQTFRHDLRIPDLIFPDAWRNLN